MERGSQLLPRGLHIDFRLSTFPFSPLFPLSNRGGDGSPPRRSDVDFIVKHSRERLTQKPPAASYELLPQGGRSALTPQSTPINDEV